MTHKQPPTKKKAEDKEKKKAKEKVKELGKRLVADVMLAKTSQTHRFVRILFVSNKLIIWHHFLFSNIQAIKQINTDRKAANKWDVLKELTKGNNSNIIFLLFKYSSRIRTTIKHIKQKKSNHRSLFERTYNRTSQQHQHVSCTYSSKIKQHITNFINKST